MYINIHSHVCLICSYSKLYNSKTIFKPIAVHLKFCLVLFNFLFTFLQALQNVTLNGCLRHFCTLVDSNLDGFTPCL